jgi:hypothetical protein
MREKERGGKRAFKPSLPPKTLSPHEHSCISSTINRGIQITLLDRNPYILEPPPTNGRDKNNCGWYQRRVLTKQT